MKGKIGKKKILLISIIAVLVIATVSVAVYAAFIRNSDAVVNTFSPATSELPIIQEAFDKNVKKDVKINVGDTDYPVYVRAAIVVNWQETGQNDGAYYFAQSSSDDYELVINEAKWEKHGDYYYYLDPVPSNGTTESLILECYPKTSAPDENYSLSVTVAAQTVQAVGRTDDDTKSSVLDAWGYSVTGETTRVPAETTAAPEETVSD